MAKKSGLGRGLDALIPGWQEDALPTVSDKVTPVAVEKIDPNPQQPRKSFDPSSSKISLLQFASMALFNLLS